MSLCFQCLIQDCLCWYPDVIGYPIQVARFERDDDHFLPEFNMPALSPGVEEKGDWLQLAYFTVAEMYMPLKHDYLDFFDMIESEPEPEPEAEPEPVPEPPRRLRRRRDVHPASAKGSVA